MKLLVLAAGYATRLYPLTRDRAKHLLPIGGRPVIDHLLDRFAPIEELDAVYVVTNTKFAQPFRQWAAAYTAPRPELEPRIVDDGTTDETNRLGAIGDLDFVLRSARIGDDLLVAAGDSYFTEPLGGLGRFGLERDAPVLAVYDVGELEAVKRYSCVETDLHGRITHLEEKPDKPKSTLAGVALYFYPARVLPLVRRYLAEGNNPDQPGRLVEWLYTRTPVYVWPVPGAWYDIGSHATLREADAVAGATVQKTLQS